MAVWETSTHSTPRSYKSSRSLECAGLTRWKSTSTSRCQRDAPTGCAAARSRIRNVIHTSGRVLTHEAVHAVQWFARDRQLGEFWVEGAADALDQIRTLDRGPVAEFVNDSPLSDDGLPHRVTSSAGCTRRTAARRNSGCCTQAWGSRKFADGHCWKLNRSTRRPPLFATRNSDRARASHSSKTQTTRSRRPSTSIAPTAARRPQPPPPEPFAR